MREMLLALVSLASATSLFNPTWTQPAKPFRVVGETYNVGSAGLAVFLIRTNAGLIVIDAGMPGCAAEIVKNIRSLGFDPRQLKWILNSHGHLDHAGGIRELQRLTGAKTAVMQQDLPLVRTGTYVGEEKNKTLNFEPVRVDRVLKDGEIIMLGGTSLTANITPGHSPGCTSWSWDQREGDRSLHVVESCSTSVALNRLVPAQYPGIVADYRRTFHRLERMRADVFLAPHSEQFGMTEKLTAVGAGKPNPFVDPTEIGRRTAASRAQFEEALAKQQAVGTDKPS